MQNFSLLKKISKLLKLTWEKIPSVAMPGLSWTIVTLKETNQQLEPAYYLIPVCSTGLAYNNVKKDLLNLDLLQAAFFTNCPSLLLYKARWSVHKTTLLLTQDSCNQFKFARREYRVLGIHSILRISTNSGQHCRQSKSLCWLTLMSLIRKIFWQEINKWWTGFKLLNLNQVTAKLQSIDIELSVPIKELMFDLNGVLIVIILMIKRKFSSLVFDGNNFRTAKK